MESICRFVTSYESELEIQPLRFVYETELNKFSQPFVFGFYKIFAVTNGTATLRFDGKNHHLSKGMLCFVLPQQSFFLDMDEGFHIVYLDFYSANVKEILEKRGVTLGSPVFYGMEFLSDFLENTIGQVRNYNSDMLMKATVSYVLSVLFVSLKEGVPSKKSKASFDAVLDFVKLNFNDPLLSLKKLGDRFFYSEKHISRLFLSKMKKGFNKYLNDLRLDFAAKLLCEEPYSVKDVAYSSGFTDPLYFSKTFKKRFGLSPSEYAKTAPDRTEKEFLYKYS